MKNYDHHQHRNKKYLYSNPSEPHNETQIHKGGKKQVIQISPSKPNVLLELPHEFKDQLRNCYEKNQNLKMAYQIEKDSHEFVRNQLAQTNEKLQEYRKYVEQLQNEYEELKEKYKRLKNNNTKKLSSRSSSPTKNKEDYAKQLQNKFNKQRQVFLKQQQLLKQELRLLNNKLETQWNTKQQELLKLQKQNEIQMSRIRINQEKLKAQLKSLTHRNTSLQRQLSYCYVKIQQKQRQLIMMQNRFDEFQNGNIKTQQNIMFIEDEISRLRAENKTLKNTIKTNEQTYKLNITKLEKQNRDFQGRLRQLYSEVQYVRDMSKDRESELFQIRKTMNNHSTIYNPKKKSAKPFNDRQLNELQSTLNCKTNEPECLDLTKLKKSYGVIRKYSSEKRKNKNKSFERI